MKNIAITHSLIWSSILGILSLKFGDAGFVYGLQGLFATYLISFVFAEKFTASKPSSRFKHIAVWSLFISGLQALSGFQGIVHGVQAIFYFYVLFLLFKPLIRVAKENHKNLKQAFTHNTHKGELHE